MYLFQEMRSNVLENEFVLYSSYEVLKNGNHNLFLHNDGYI